MPEPFGHAAGLAMTAMETPAMEAATVEAVMEATTMPAAEAKPDHRAADIGRAVAASVGVVVGAIGVADRTGCIRDRSAESDHHTGRRRRRCCGGGTRQYQRAKSNLCEAFH